ncbi:hypothetical protein [Chryseobacterium sp. T1]
MPININLAGATIKSLQLESMISKKGEFSATVQFNADKPYSVELLFDKSNSNQKTQNPLQEIPKIFRGK